MRSSLVITTFTFAVSLGFTPTWAKPLPPQGSPQVQVDYGPYNAYMQLAIKRQWRPPAGKGPRKCMTLFNVHRNGSISDARIKQSSSDADFDTASLNTLKKVSLKPLPEGAPETVDAQFTFVNNETKSGAASGAASPTNSTAAARTSSSAAPDKPSKPTSPEDGVYALAGLGMLCAMVVIFFQTIMAVWIALWLGIERLKLRWSRRTQ
jgi:TonB family protein